MQLPKELLDQLCICSNVACTKPHTVYELEKQKLLPPKKTECPECHQSDEITEYEYEGVKEAFCDRCGINFDVVTGNLIITETNFDEKPKHIMHLGSDQIYQCEACSFETSFMTEVIQHQNGSILAPVDAKKTGNDPHYVNWIEKNTWKCKYCQKTFDNWAQASAHENDEGKKLNPVISTYTSGYSSYKHCVHKPQKVMEGDGWSIHAGRKWDCESDLNDFDIVLNLTGNKVSKTHDIPVKILKKWESKAKYQEICLDWPDRGIVDLPKQFWRDFFGYVKTNKKKVVVFCIGGHGRTGTAIASLLVVGFNYQPEQACSWIWTNYCKEAIETDGQLNYVYNLVGKKYIPPSQQKDKKESNTPRTEYLWD